MARATWVLAATTIAGFATSLWLFLDRPSAPAPDCGPAPKPQTQAAARSADPWIEPARAATSRSSATPEPTLPEQKDESRLERRQRRQMEIAAMLGRNNGETEDEYRARMVPLIKGGLAVPRMKAEELRKEIEAKAHVTAEQSQKLDHAFDKVYGDVLDYTNRAIADGQLSPYERNVAGWLEYAGGLGGVLGDAQTQIGEILSSDQMKTISESGFEWGEYLGLEAPWEQLKPPPPRK
jgi:hypothetical protein